MLYRIVLFLRRLEVEYSDAFVKFKILLFVIPAPGRARDKLQQESHECGFGVKS